MFSSFLSYQFRFKYLSLFSFSVIFLLHSAETAKFTIRQVLTFFLLIITWSGLLDGIRWSVDISKSQLIMYKQMSSCLLKMLSTKYSFRNLRISICKNKICHEINYKSWYAIKQNNQRNHKNSKEFCASYSPWQILICVYKNGSKRIVQPFNCVKTNDWY